MTRPTSTAQPRSTLGEVATLALAGQGRCGVVTELAETNGISRQEVYALRDRARVAVEAEFARSNDAPSGGFTLEVTEEDIKRTVIALRVVTPSSIRDEVAMLPIIYGSG